MKIRLGDFFRSVVPKDWALVRWVLEVVKGVTIRVRGHDILLDQKHGDTRLRSAMHQKDTNRLVRSSEEFRKKNPTQRG